MERSSAGFPCFPQGLCLSSQSRAGFWCYPTLLLFALGWEEQVLFSPGLSLPQPVIRQVKGFSRETQRLLPCFTAFSLCSQLGMHWDSQGSPQAPHEQAGHHLQRSRGVTGRVGAGNQHGGCCIPGAGYQHGDAPSLEQGTSRQGCWWGRSILWDHSQAAAAVWELGEAWCLPSSYALADVSCLPCLEQLQLHTSQCHRLVPLLSLERGWGRGWQEGRE